MSHLLFFELVGYNFLGKVHVQQKIIGFHKDSDHHWVADLACGHKQHVRHDPPMVEREWVLTKEGRAAHLGFLLNCRRCDEVGLVVARTVQEVCIEMVNDAYLQAGQSGLCPVGQIDLIVDRLKSLDLRKISQDAIANSTTDLGTLSVED
jgi:hypothetical protein